MLTMNPEIREQWVAALESGEYKQGKGWLCPVDDGNRSYCCLGVLADLAVKAGIIDEPTTFEANHLEDSYLVFGGASATLPLEVQEWAGLDDSDPSADGEYKPLSQYNDDDEYTFKEIAAKIKA